MHLNLAHPAGRLGVLLALVDAENPNTILGRQDAAAVDQRQHVARAGGVAVRVAPSGELSSLACFCQALNPADAVRARLPLRQDGRTAGFLVGAVAFLRAVRRYDNPPADHAPPPNPP